MNKEYSRINKEWFYLKDKILSIDFLEREMDRCEVVAMLDNIPEIISYKFI